MSDLDLSAAVAVAYRTFCEAQHGGPMGDGDFEATRSRVEEAWMETVVAAAAPLIEAQVRAQVAAEIEAAGREDVLWLTIHAEDNIDRARSIGAEDAYKASVRIARGESL